MGKEKKIGMAALGVLTLALAGVAGVKLFIGGGAATNDGPLAAGGKVPGSMLPQGAGGTVAPRPTALTASPAPLSARAAATSPPSLAASPPAASVGGSQATAADKPPSATISRSTASSTPQESNNGSSLGFSSRGPTPPASSAAPSPAAAPAFGTTPSADPTATVAATEDRYGMSAPPPAAVTDRYAPSGAPPTSPVPATSYPDSTPANVADSDPFGRAVAGPSPAAAPAPLPTAARDSTALGSPPPSAAPFTGYPTDRYAPTAPGYGAATPYSAAGGSTPTPAAPVAPPYTAAPGMAATPYSTGADLAAGQLTAASGRLDREQTYTAGPHETFWSIAERVYGDPAYFRALYEYNRDRYPQGNDLRPGDVVDLPALATLAAKYPELMPRSPGAAAVDPGRMLAAPDATAAGPRVPAGGRLYVVQQGDTLFDIARRELGRASRWAEIYELNRDQLGANFDYLTAGMQLALPPPTGSTGDPTAVRPGAAVPR